MPNKQRLPPDGQVRLRFMFSSFQEIVGRCGNMAYVELCRIKGASLVVVFIRKVKATVKIDCGFQCLPLGMILLKLLSEAKEAAVLPRGKEAGPALYLQA